MIVIFVTGCSNNSDYVKAIPLEFVKVNGGTIKGSDASGVFIEGRTVELDSFYMSKYEITQA